MAFQDRIWTSFFRGVGSILATFWESPGLHFDVRDNFVEGVFFNEFVDGVFLTNCLDFMKKGGHPVPGSQ